MNDKVYRSKWLRIERMKNGIRAYVTSGGGDDDRGTCQLVMQLFGFWIELQIPRIVWPEKKWVLFSETLSDGRVGYWALTRRDYGLSLHDGLFSLKYGRQTLDSSTEQRWSKFLPWTQWRFYRMSYYGLTGDTVYTNTRQRRGWDAFRAEQDAKELCPRVTFQFNDYDGELIEATTMIEEREWKFGEGWFKWLSLFRKPKVSRSLDISFSKETGERKGSWKGGTIGHSIEMESPTELHESAFRRYCVKHKMTFIGKLP